jgi:transcriptional regulator with XRE-family HTH domain
MDAELMPSLAVRDVGALFWWLHRRGWSQTQIGAMTGQSQPEVSAIMHGRQVQAYSVVVRVADGLGIPRGYFGMSDCVGCAAGGTPLRGQGEDEGDDPVLRREFLTAAAVVAAGGKVADLDRWLPGRMPSAAGVPTRVGATEVAQVRAVTAELRDMGERYGPGAALDAVSAYAGWARGMLRSRTSDAVGRDLRIALGELHALIGWSHHGAGSTTGLRQHYLQVMDLARDADEPEQTADALGDLADAAIWRRHPHDGLRLARTGLAAAPGRVSPATTAWLHVCEANAWARLGDEHGVREALGRAADDLSRADPAAVPTWATSGRYFLHAGALAGYRIRIHSELSRYPEHSRYAETAAEQGQAALAAYDGNRSWHGVVLDRVALAAAQLRAGARDEGLATAHRAIDEVATLRSRRARDGLADIADAAGGYPDHRDAKDLRARLATVAAG